MRRLLCTILLSIGAFWACGSEDAGSGADAGGPRGNADASVSLDAASGRGGSGGQTGPGGAGGDPIVDAGPGGAGGGGSGGDPGPGPGGAGGGGPGGAGGGGAGGDPGPGPGGSGGTGGMSGGGRLGDPCDEDADCDGGACILGLPGGYCSTDCTDTECAEGASCWGLGDAGTWCLKDCTEPADCRVGDGYTCDGDNTCFPPAGGDPPGDGEIGGACAADGDCAGGGRCVAFTGGYCIVDGCSEQQPCPDGAACYIIDDQENTACLAACTGRADCREGYVCDPVGACLPACTVDSCAEGQVCGADGLCTDAPCTPDSCLDGLVCGDAGRCQVDLGAAPPGPVPACRNLPDWQCDGDEAFCGALVTFNPRAGDGYEDYPINGETDANQYRSYIRRDVSLLVKYAAAQVRCLTADWEFGNGPPVGLGDMSERNGDIPGTSVGSPGHPAGTHENGHDMDIGYFQVGTGDNHLRPICPHVIGGVEQYHCVAPPETLDVWRTALFIGKLHDSPQLRVIGCDGQAGPLIEAAVQQLCEDGWLAGDACRDLRLTYEVEDEGRGWFLFHLHHFHISVLGRPSAGLPGRPLSGALARRLCLTPDCLGLQSPASDPRRRTFPLPELPGLTLP